MNGKPLLAAILVALGLAAPGWAWPAEKVRVGFPSLAIPYLPFYVAREKGLFQKAGLDAEYIQMKTEIQPQAVINGEIDFFPSVSTGLAAAVAGLPLVVVLNLYDGSPWILVAGKEIEKPKDFVGKKVAVSGIRTAPYRFVLAGLKKMGLDEKDVGFISTGGTTSSFALLTTHQVAGAVLTPPFDDKAVSLGFKKFLFLGDLVDIPYVGMITSQAAVQSHRDRVQRTIGVVLEAVSWVRSNREESVKMIGEKFDVPRSEAERAYETILGLLTKDGRLSLKVARGYFDVLRQERPVPSDLDPQKFLDFSMLPPR